ncbi:hypothetical protein HOLleu_32063 [Holothuria leucospilota]|uniref:SRCR domain-containing protein n=1 Tax=Holothuria leucospilota TaxID=206669 RepID=A0A9Q0YRD9_HOLLE|nr:hypothetical protein HOLleu_32063 [Holothuria leucospilota]
MYLQETRLVDGHSNNSGRLEVLINGEWGTVCDDKWNLKDATVACRQLGFPAAIFTYMHAHFGEGFGRIWMSDVQCKGTELSLLECKHERYQKPSCKHTDDVGVLCGALKHSFSGTERYLQETRLVDGHSNNSGRLEVLINGEWGTVCDREWSLKDATVACRQLGFPAAIFTYIHAHFGEGFGRIWMSNVQCKGTELSLLECKHERFPNLGCNHTADVGVLCGGKERNHLRKSFTSCHEIYKYQLCLKSNH